MGYKLEAKPVNPEDKAHNRHLDLAPESVREDEKLLFEPEEGEDEEAYVTLLDGDEKKKQRVRVGRREGEKLEILRGLNPGDKILAKNPE